jgi:hypothetical protein
MFFQKIFFLTLSLIFLLINFGCSINIESCLEEESCGPVIKVIDFEGSLPDNPFDPFWNSGQASLKIYDLNYRATTFFFQATFNIYRATKIN